MAKRTLADDIYYALLARAPHEITSIQKEKSEGMSKHARVKAVHVAAGRIMFRVLEPGHCEEVYVSSKDIPSTITAVHGVLARLKVPLNRVGC